MVDQRVYTERRKRSFLKAFRRSTSTRSAAEKAGIGPTTVYEWRRKDPEFAKAFAALKEQTIELMADDVLDRAWKGVDDVIVQGGKVVKDDDGNPIMRTTYDNNLAWRMLCVHSPLFRGASTGDIEAAAKSMHDAAAAMLATFVVQKKG